MDELKRCPFCGGEAIILDDDMYCVRCNKCLCGTELHFTLQKAISTWNRRADGWVDEMNDAVYALSQALCIGGLGEMRNAASDVWRIWDTKNEPQPPKKGE